MPQIEQALGHSPFEVFAHVERARSRGLVKDARHGRMRVDLKRLDRFGDRLHSAMDRATVGIMTLSLLVGFSIVMTIAEGLHLTSEAPYESPVYH